MQSDFRGPYISVSESTKSGCGGDFINEGRSSWLKRLLAGRRILEIDWTWSCVDVLLNILNYW